MLNVFPIPLRKLISSKTENQYLLEKREKAWRISHYSDSNIQFLMHYASKLLKSQSSSEIIVTNSLDKSEIPIKYTGTVSEAVLVFWNIASLLSDSLKYLLMDDKQTRQIYYDRISLIIKLFYSLQTEFLPSLNLDSKSDMTIQNATFYHAIYSAHFYEILLKNKDDFTVTTINSLIASKYFDAAAKFTKIKDGLQNLKNKSIYYNIRSIISHSNSEKKAYHIGSSIYFINMALDQLNSANKQFRSSEFFPELQTEINEFKTQIERDNRIIYFERVGCNIPLPEIEQVDPILRSGINSLLANDLTDDERLNNDLNEIITKTDQIKNVLLNVSDSISMLTSLLYECDSSRKSLNTKLYQNADMDQSTKFDVIQGIEQIERRIENIFSWISSARTVYSPVFDIDNSCQKLMELKKKAQSIIGLDMIDSNEVDDIIASMNSELAQYETIRNIDNQMSQNTEECFQIMEEISNIDKLFS